MSKNRLSAILVLLGLALTLAFSGCAGAYHDYSDCCIPYLYCAPRPLPYVTYDGCHCPTPGATRYAQQPRLATDPADSTPETAAGAQVP